MPCELRKSACCKIGALLLYGPEFFFSSCGEGKKKSYGKETACNFGRVLVIHAALCEMPTNSGRPVAALSRIQPIRKQYLKVEY